MMILLLNPKRFIEMKLESLYTNQRKQSKRFLKNKNKYNRDVFLKSLVEKVPFEKIYRTLNNFLNVYDVSGESKMFNEKA
jgi:hypothetical protein